MASKYDGLRNLCTKSGFYKSVYKGEDAWLQKPATPFSISDKGPVKMDVYAVFDGHGGKQAATFASRNLTEKLVGLLRKSASSDKTSKGSPDLHKLSFPAELDNEVWTYWESQDKLMEVLPGCLTEAFCKLQEDFFQQTKTSGTTATVAVLIGWELIVANVGDSCAFLDTGSEVLQTSGNHRLDDSKSEQDRIKLQGFEVSSSNLEGRPCGPLRVWPGGLAMGRSLGDYEAGDIVLTQPEVRQVTLPSTGGRIIIASDGLWDSVTPKTAAHHVRGLPASKAARELGQAALKGKGLRDDITVIVVDFMPDENQKLPPQLSKDGSGQLVASSAPSSPVNIFHPLEDTDAAQAARQSIVWERRAEIARAAFPDFGKEPEADTLSLDSQESVVPFTDLEDKEQSGADNDSDASETLAANLHANPYALGNQDYELERNLEQGNSIWETVPSKSKAVPSGSRKHPLSLNEGSPSTPWQVPKALKEAPPSPASSPMQTTEPTNPRETQGRGSGRRGRGRSRGRGRGPSGRGREKINSNQDQQTYPVSGFEVTQHQQAQPEQVSPFQPGPRQETALNLSFLDGGGFSFQPMPNEPSRESLQEYSASTTPSYKGFSSDGPRAEVRRGGRTHVNQSRRAHNRNGDVNSESQPNEGQDRGSKAPARPRHRQRKPARTDQEPTSKQSEASRGLTRTNGRGRNHRRDGEERHRQAEEQSGRDVAAAK